MKTLRVSIIFLAFSLLAACGGGGSGGGVQAPATTARSFAMGFTPFPYDVDPLTIGAVVDDIYARLAGDNEDP